MELKDLSSNWKKLQESLKTANPSSKKRKAGETEEKEDEEEGRRRLFSAKRPRRAGNLKQTNSSNAKSAPQSNDKVKDKMGIISSTTKKIKPNTSALAIWAKENNISSKDLAAAYGPPPPPRSSSSSSSLKRNPSSILGVSQHTGELINGGLAATAGEVGKYIGIDCEMVGVGPTPDKDSALARISIVDYNGKLVYDSFVLPKEPVADYRTYVSGITPQLLQSARTLEEVQKDVAPLMDGRILVGHAVRHDLDALLLGHPRRDIRDTSRYPQFRKLAGGKTPSLKKLAREILGIDIQSSQHSSVEDARATMLLFRKEKTGFDREHAKVWRTGR